MKVCFVLENFYPYVGGAETVFKEITTRLVRLGCEVKVFTSNSGGIDGVSQHDGVEVYHFPWRSFFGHAVPDVKDLYEGVEWCDLVHTTTYTAAPKALKVAKRFNKPCLITVHEALGKKWFWVEKNYVNSSLFFAFERYVIKRDFSLYHAVSLATQADLMKCGVARESIVTIHPGLKEAFTQQGNDRTSPLETSANGGAKVFLFFGRPGKTKGVFVLYDAMKKIAGRDF